MGVLLRRKLQEDSELGLFTTLFCVMLLPIGDKETGRRVTLTGETDSGNHFEVSRWSTTKAPLSLIMMELAIQCRFKGIDLHLEWIPRGQNIEADELSIQERDQSRMQYQAAGLYRA